MEEIKNEIQGKHVVITGRFSCQSFPLNDKAIFVSEEDLLQVGISKCFDIENNCVVDYVPNTQKTQEQLEIEYENLIVSKIREKYNVNQELAILRQRDTKPEEFAIYNAYVEQCKYEVKTFGK